MKIQVKDLRPNPYRKIEKYPIDREKVEALKISINETSFWDNILARQKGNHFEIAYGHHRWIALQELNIKEVDIPIRELDKYTMYKIMADENMDTWKTNPKVLYQTVQGAKELLDEEFKKYNDINKLSHLLIDLLEGETPKAQKNALEKAKRGVGQTIILKFLGKNYKQWMIQEALSVFKDDKEGTIDKEAIEQFDDLSKAKTFKKAVKDYRIPKEKQKELAEEIIKKGVGKRNVADEVMKTIPKKEKETKNPELTALEKELTKIEEKTNSLYHTVVGINLKLKELNIIQIEGLQTFFTGHSLSELLPVLKEFISFFPIQENETLPPLK